MKTIFQKTFYKNLDRLGDSESSLCRIFMYAIDQAAEQSRGGGMRGRFLLAQPSSAARFEVQEVQEVQEV